MFVWSTACAHFSGSFLRPEIYFRKIRWISILAKKFWTENFRSVSHQIVHPIITSTPCILFFWFFFLTLLQLLKIHLIYYFGGENSNKKWPSQNFSSNFSPWTRTICFIIRLRWRVMCRPTPEICKKIPSVPEISLLFCLISKYTTLLCFQESLFAKPGLAKVPSLDFLEKHLHLRN